jgi:hypothetical protein
MNTITDNDAQGELEHRQVKRFYPRVHKGQFAQGITKQQPRGQILYKMQRRAPPFTSKLSQKWKYVHTALGDATTDPRVPFNDPETLPPSSPDKHHEISQDVRHKIDLPRWLGEHQGDLATKVRDSVAGIFSGLGITPYRTLFLILKTTC